jgi:hypothetical protein
MQRTRIQHTDALNDFVTDFMRMAVEKDVDLGIKEATDFTFEMAVRHTHAEH